MPDYKVRAVVLKTYRLGEHDKIIKLYAFEKGLITAVAKGALKQKNRFGARLELYNVLDLEISEARSIDIISQAEIIGRFKNISSDFYKFTFCQIISDIILKTQSEEQYANHLFKLLYIVLKKIDVLDGEDARSMETITSFFIAKLLNLMGYGPNLKHCGTCSSEIGPEERSVSFSIPKGSVICRRCAQGSREGFRLDGKKYDVLKKMFHMQPKELEGLEIDEKTALSVLGLLGHYLMYHTDARIECLNYLKKIDIN